MLDGGDPVQAKFECKEVYTFCLIALEHNRQQKSSINANKN